MCIRDRGYWDLPAGTQGEKHIIIDLKQQKVFYYVGTTLVGLSLIHILL